MLSKIIRALNRHNLEEGTTDDTPELVAELRQHFVDEAINEMIDDNQYIVVDSKYFVKVSIGTFTKFAEMNGTSAPLIWHSEWVKDLQLNEGFTLNEMEDIIRDIIIRNDLLTTS